MINKLLSLLQKPTLWQRSLENFWDDEHISKGLSIIMFAVTLLTAFLSFLLNKINKNKDNET